MKTHVDISVGTLFAAAIVSIAQIVGIVVNRIVPLFLMPLLKDSMSHGVKEFFNRSLLLMLQQIAYLAITTIFLIVCAVIFFIASQQIRKGSRPYAWSVTALVFSSLLMALGGITVLITGLMGIVGATVGIIYSGKKGDS